MHISLWKFQPLHEDQDAKHAINSESGLHVHMAPQIFDCRDPFWSSDFYLLLRWCVVIIIYGIHQGYPTQLLPYLMQKSASATSTANLSIKKEINIVQIQRGRADDIYSGGKSPLQNVRHRQHYCKDSDIAHFTKASNIVSS